MRDGKITAPEYRRKQRCLSVFERESRVKRIRLKKLLYMAICCDLGIISKRLISPFANVIIDSLHVPGGIGTSFSLMFLVIGAALTDTFGSGLLMGFCRAGLHWRLARSERSACFP